MPTLKKGGGLAGVSICGVFWRVNEMEMDMMRIQSWYGTVSFCQV